MRQHYRNFIICLYEKSPLQNCFASQNMLIFCKLRERHAEILCGFPVDFLQNCRKSTLLRRVIPKHNRLMGCSFCLAKICFCRSRKLHDWERCDRRRWRMKGAERVAAVEKMEQTKCEHFFGHRNRTVPGIIKQDSPSQKSQTS